VAEIPRRFCSLTLRSVSCSAAQMTGWDGEWPFLDEATGLRMHGCAVRWGSLYDALMMRRARH
jgi:hypothetical protein